MNRILIITLIMIDRQIDMKHEKKKTQNSHHVVHVHDE